MPDSQSVYSVYDKISIFYMRQNVYHLLYIKWNIYHLLYVKQSTYHLMHMFSIQTKLFIFYIKAEAYMYIGAEAYILYGAESVYFMQIKKRKTNKREVCKCELNLKPMFGENKIISAFLYFRQSGPLPVHGAQVCCFNSAHISLLSF